MSRIQDLNMMLGREFGMKDLGYAQKILYMEIRRDRETRRLWLSQGKHIFQVIAKSNSLDFKIVFAPLVEHFKLRAQLCLSTNEEKDEMSKIPYAKALGCLMYPMV